jgi:hypothetical protein
MSRYNLPIIYGLNPQGNAIAILVDSFGRLIPSPQDGTLLCTAQCALGGKAYQGFSARVFTIFAIASLNINTALPIKIFKWDRLPSVALTGMTLFKEVLVNDSFIFEFSGTAQYISVFAVNPGSGFYDGCCFTVSGDALTLVGFS